jgi:hypothetical protein
MRKLQYCRALVDDEGNVVSVKPTSSKFTASYDEREGYRIQRNTMGFTHYNGADMPSNVTFADMGRLYVLASYLANDNALGYWKSKKFYFFKTAESIGETIGVKSKTSSRDFIRKMVRCGALRKVKGVYYMNPAIAIKNGERLTYKAFSLFYMDCRGLMAAKTYQQMIEDCIAKGFLTKDDFARAKDLMK